MEEKQKIYELIEWWDVSTGARMEDYRIEERSLGLFDTRELAEKEIGRINNNLKKFKIRVREKISRSQPSIDWGKIWIKYLRDCVDNWEELAPLDIFNWFKQEIERKQ
jgi:hypothetical protein